MRRQLAAVVALLLVAGVAAVGWVAGTRVQSPEMAAARAAPPDPSPITAEVELRVLSSRVIVRGNVVPGQAANVTGPSSENDAIVTGVFVEEGDELAEGDAVVAVSGRPVVVFEGEVPAFRSMRPGQTGTDVDQLQAALGRLNCDAAADDGVYGEATKECVARLYEALGYDTVPTSDDEATNLAEARDAAAAAEEELTEAQAALEEKTDPPAGDLAEAEIAVNVAQRKLDNDAAANADKLAEAAAAVDTAMVALNAKLADRNSTPADRAKVLADLEAAVLKEQTALREGAEATAAAEEGLRQAEANLAELTAPDVETETRAVEQAEAKVERTAQALTDLEAVSGPTVPLGEVVFVDALPATVSTFNAEVGASVSGTDNNRDGSSDPLAVLATSGLRVVAYVPPSDADLVQEGMDVELTDDTVSQDTVAATLTSLSDQVESEGDERGFRAIIEGVDPLPREWTERNVRVIFTAAATENEVLVVPQAALSSGADGQARVEVLEDDGTVTTVNVEAGLDAEGFVEVTPTGDAELGEGDLVIVGSNA